MRTLIIFLLANNFILSHSPVSAQSSEYTIESFQDEYTELTEYESMSLIFFGSPLWEYEFQLDFPFPFYGEFYDKLLYRSEAWGSVTDEEDEALFLMDFTGGYSYDDIEDTLNIPSDVRFSHVFSNNMQAFVIQYTKSRFFADPFADSLDTYLNFQLWFFENGVMEVHFGEMHMDGTPIYAPGKGFYCYDSFNGVDTNEVCGPHVGISNPLDEEDAIALSGRYDDFEVTDYIYDDLTVLPPQGWVIRFKPTTVATSDLRTYGNLVISPNPTNDFVHLPSIYGRIIVFDANGKIVYEDYQEKYILNVSGLPSGIYYIKIITGDKIYTGKFVRQ